MTVAEVSSIAQAFHEGVANRDAGAVAALYADDATFMPPNFEPCEGREAIHGWLQQMLAAGVTSLDIEPQDIREAGDLTVEYGRYTLGIEPEGAEAMTDVGTYIVVHESQDDGSTRIVYDIFNSNLPAATA
jgi:uncharacterized protein (TIGR02246 family)